MSVLLSKIDNNLKIEKVVQPRTHTHDDGKDTRFAKRS